MKANETFRYIVGYILAVGLFLIAIPLGLWHLSRVWPASFILPGVLHWSMAALLLVIGIWFAAWSNLDLFVIGQGGPVDAFNVAIHPRTKRLLVTGPYQYTRNPMVFGTFMLYLALVVALESWSALIVLAAFFLCALVYLKQTEEKRLLRDFGKEYEEYKKKVPMIVPFLF